MSSDFTWPQSDQHTAVVGRNGTGKSQAGAYILSRRDLGNSRTVVIDYKGEELFNSLERIREIGMNEIPQHNGLYIIYADPEDDDNMRAWLRRVRKTGNVGLFVDEGYMIPGERRGPFQALLTQGRALHIPVITLSQRPVEINRFVFSESSHIIVFDLSDERDRDTVRNYTPTGFMDWVPDSLAQIDEHTGEKMLPKYHARWYNKTANKRFVLKPVPEAPEIVQAIDSQLQVKHRWI